MNKAIEKIDTADIDKAENKVTPMTLIAAAQQSNASGEQMQQLFELQLRWEASEARKAYNKAIAEFKLENVKIKKDATVDFTYKGQQTYYQYESLSGVVDAVVNVLAKYGLNHSWTTDQSGSSIKVSCKLSHRDGHSESISLIGDPDTGAGKNSIQAIGSTVRYLQRYTLMSILGLASSKRDDDGREAGRDDSKFITESQLADLCAIADEVGADEKGFLAHMGVSELRDIPKNRFKFAIESLEKKRKKQ